MSTEKRRYCISPREVASNQFCISQPEGVSTLRDDFVCISPVVSEVGVEFVKLGLNSGQFVLFHGTLSQLYHSVQIGEWNVRWKFLLRFLSLAIPEAVENLFRYVATISSAMGILNMAPMFFVDGHWAFQDIMMILFPKMTKARRKLICCYVFTSVTILLVLNCISFFAQ